jgi:beta-glucosidase
MKYLVTALAGTLAVVAHAQDGSPESRAAATEQQMTADERVLLTFGIMPIVFGRETEIPAEALLGAGYISGIPRLGVPALQEVDASLGVAWNRGARGPSGATPLPSGLSLASTWNPELARRAGALIGSEAKAKGFNILLAGGVNLVRDPRNGRNFEYLGEDPLLAGTLAGESIAGIQSNRMISTVKHFALNAQETGRSYLDARISTERLRESDLLAFQIAIERGQPGSVMCAYNKVNGENACANGPLLNDILKRDWKYKGFVMSDWGAVPGIEAALSGLDQQSGSQLDKEPYFSTMLRDKAKQDKRYADRLSDMNRRILYAIYANGLDKYPAVKKPIDLNAGLAIAGEAAREGIVLLRNERGALPLTAKASRIAVIGGYADSGVLSGGGSSQVHLDDGPALVVPLSTDGPFARFSTEQYQRSNPLKAIRKRAPGAEVVFRHGNYLEDAVAAARGADVAIVFANQWTTEGYDVPGLSLPNRQDVLIEAIAAANPNTIVVLQTGGPVFMPWLSKTAAVLEAWYPGGDGGEAIASVLFGETNPSGRLPVTFPASLSQLPRPVLDGSDLEPDFLGRPPKPGMTLSVNYDIEGSDVGYRWNARQGYTPLFPFGFGLSYTTFAHSDLTIKSLTANVSVKNNGQRAGADVPQLYLVRRPDGAKRRLVAFRKVTLAPGEKQTVSMSIDPRLLADWRDGKWQLRGGLYEFAVGSSSDQLGPRISVRLPGRVWKQ